ncbi:MAG: hypothetical protein C0393_01595, partial [Anaerolinea sp.]|nr:hypothetical protein [Anaerolinea sp.]
RFFYFNTLNTFANFWHSYFKPEINGDERGFCLFTEILGKNRRLSPFIPGEFDPKQQKLFLAKVLTLFQL